jgi:hypothetical protein
LDKKVRVAFDWTLDLLFPKDVCAVYDVDQRRDFDRQDHTRNMLENNGDYQLSVRQPVQSNMEDGLTGIERIAKEQDVIC